MSEEFLEIIKYVGKLAQDKGEVMARLDNYRLDVNELQNQLTSEKQNVKRLKDALTKANKALEEMQEEAKKNLLGSVNEENLPAGGHDLIQGDSFPFDSQSS